jgi:hypothetical protein
MAFGEGVAISAPNDQLAFVQAGHKFVSKGPCLVE